MNANESLMRLKDGNARFVRENPQNNLHYKEKIKSLVNGQHPYAIILGCADSRVVPELAFDARLGDLFVVRVAGNIANTSSIASIEFAIANLEIKLIVVMGHSGCEAVTAAIAGRTNGKNINHLYSFISPAILASGNNAPVSEVIQNNIKFTIKDLKLKSEIISNAIDNEDVVVVPAYYNMNSGIVDFI